MLVQYLQHPVEILRYGGSLAAGESTFCCHEIGDERPNLCEDRVLSLRGGPHHTASTVGGIEFAHDVAGLLKAVDENCRGCRGHVEPTRKLDRSECFAHHVLHRIDLTRVEFEATRYGNAQLGHGLQHGIQRFHDVRGWPISGCADRGLRRGSDPTRITRQSSDLQLVSMSLERLATISRLRENQKLPRRTIVRFPTGHVARRRNAFLMLGLVIVLVGLIFAAPAPTPAAALVSSGLPTSYQSAEAELRQQALPSEGVAPAIVVYSREDGGALTQQDKAAVTARAQALAPLGVGGQGAPAVYSPDGKVAIVSVPVDTTNSDSISPKVAQIRTVAATDLPAGLRAQVTGGPAITADLTKVFDGADTTLLLATASVVAVLLLITYRSPWLWLVPLIVVGIAEQTTTKLVELLAPHAGIVVDPAASGITSVLVFGAATDYALLLIARYRDRLRQDDSRFHAMQIGLRRTSEPILASAATVTLSLLALLLAQQESLRAIGFSSAIGVIVAMLFGLFVLPAAMVVFGRGLFWPFVPRVGDTAREGKFWGRIGESVRRRPNLIGIGATLVLLVLALGAIGLQVGLSQNEQFRVKPEAVLGQETLASAFPAGSSAPATVLTTPSSVAAVTAAAKATPGVVSVTPGPSAGNVAQLQVVLSAEPGSQQSFDEVIALRASVGAVRGGEAVVGGDTATRLDSKDAATRDAKVIIPIVLVLVFTVLVLLLRSLLAPVLLVATVLGTFFAALGASWWVFQHVLHYPALDNGVLILSFLFLVALGVDYNIFLATRAREEAMASNTRDGMLTALKATGGVITSAGILLAAVFAVLGVLPLIALAQVGLIVCIGVLLDTLLVRTVLVPALAFIFGERFWWPAHVDGRGHHDADGALLIDEAVAAPAS